MSGKNSGEELNRALVRYERWVLLRFLKIELQIEDYRSGNRKKPILYMTITELLKILCSSMIVPGMSADLMYEVLHKLVKDDILHLEQVGIPKDDNIVGGKKNIMQYYLTPEGNLRAMREFGKVLDYDDIIKLEYNDQFSSPKLKHIQEHIHELIKKNVSSIFIKFMLIDEYLVSFPLTELIKNSLGFKI